jgi:RimJ/RimL family protein N-acetyltransferase
MSNVKAPEQVETSRLLLRRPLASDADAIFGRFAADPDVTRLVGWPTHTTVDDTRAFLAFSDTEWEQWPAGPYLVFLREDGSLVGGTGLAFETPYRAATGYVFAKNAWGRGYATEALRAMVDLAQPIGVRRLYALCHTDHVASRRVLEKCGLAREGILRRHYLFPNLDASEPCDVFCYARIF